VKIYLFYHSVISDWNHGNAHFLRGLVSSLHDAGNKVQVLEPQNGWSLRNLLFEKGLAAYHEFKELFPYHVPILYSENGFDPDEYLYDADLVIVHEWNHPEIVKKIGDYKAINNNMILLFHDTHHRSVTDPEAMARYDLKNYDGVLAFGEIIKEIYLQKGWAENVWTWHEAADSRIFHPVNSKEKEGDLVWIGNWGDDERTEELNEFIIKPVRELGLKACFYGVRYPDKAVKLLKRAKIKYKGWLPNFKVPEIFSKFKVTVHVPRRPYVTSLPGIPTIRPFEALSCGIPLVCSTWHDRENLFTSGRDYLVARDSLQMKKHLSKILDDENYANSLTSNGLKTISSRHTCDHRVAELMNILNEINAKKLEKNIESSFRLEYK
jgi:spore maturation protein CgeB